MLFSHYERYQYAASPLVEVICQLRFPTILVIGAADPVQFQDRMRMQYPQYVAKKEQPQPRVVNGKVEQAPPITNHTFISADGTWKLNLTKDFIALSTVRYTRWEDFAARLDEVLACFIQIYRPAYFERIGLRYVNAFSKTALHLEDKYWKDIIQAPFLNLLLQEDVAEQSVTKCATDALLDLDGDIQLHLQCGPGKVGKDSTEVKFILDHDYSVRGNLQANLVPGQLEEMHKYAVRLLRAAVKDETHVAMGPTLI